MLQEKTNQIKNYSKSIKDNFFRIGKVLIEIRDKELFNEKYKSFTEYLISEDFEFTRTHAYKLIDVYEKFGVSTSIHSLDLSKLMELTYVPDKEKREELVKKTIDEDLSVMELREEVQKVRAEDLYKGIKRKAQREDQDLYTENDDPLAKCKRQAQSILQDIQRLSYPLNDMETRLKNWIKFSRKFKDKEINKLKKAIATEWKKIRTSKRSDDGWFD